MLSAALGGGTVAAAPADTKLRGEQRIVAALTRTHRNPQRLRYYCIYIFTPSHAIQIVIAAAPPTTGANAR